MQHNLLAVSWAVAFLPTPRLKAVVCCTGSKGEAAFQRTLQCGYPERNVIHVVVEICKSRCMTSPTILNRILPASQLGGTPTSPPQLRELGGGRRLLPKYARRIAVTGNMRNLPKHFLEGAMRVSSVTLDLPALEAIPDFFFSTCEDLLEITFRSPLPKVRSIGCCFLRDCSAIRTVDLSPLSNVEKVGPHFMQGCFRLKKIDLRPLWRLKVIDMYFMSGCADLSDVELTPLKSVEEVRVGFFSNSTNIAHLDLTFFVGKRLGLASVAGWTGVRTVDLAPLKGVASLPACFLMGFSSLTTIDLDPLSGIADVGSGFLAECQSLTSIELGPLASIRFIPSSFLQGCTHLQAVDLKPFRRIKVCNGLFLNFCERIYQLDLSPLSHLEEIGACFLRGCKGLSTLNLRPLRRVKTVGPFFLAECVGLSTLDVSPLSRLAELPPLFLHKCTGLQTLDLSKFAPSSLPLGFEAFLPIPPQNIVLPVGYGVNAFDVLDSTELFELPL